MKIHCTCNKTIRMLQKFVASFKNMNLYVGNYKINLQLDGKKKHVVIAPKRTLSSKK